MKLYCFSVKDRATDAYGSPMFMVATGQAVRSFTDEVNRDAADNQLFVHPDDFDLYELGSFDTDAGEFESFSPRLLCRGKDVSLSYKESN